jgi:hypothetical protein
MSYFEFCHSVDVLTTMAVEVKLAMALMMTAV